ncbi:hypothetical protein QJS10_CPA06g02496 [Acorus calamus]|uniref:Uncharacterized protein n=1 Tax=Acorus calamus TaxID=4465 RepID=A0AAV9ELS8_ACOCL|nr:hypothetical protein QJS10_CPA06g02496 [Acorus calamus]
MLVKPALKGGFFIEQGFFIDGFSSSCRGDIRLLLHRRLLLLLRSCRDNFRLDRS